VGRRRQRFMLAWAKLCIARASSRRLWRRVKAMLGLRGVAASALVSGSTRVPAHLVAPSIRNRRTAMTMKVSDSDDTSLKITRGAAARRAAIAWRDRSSGRCHCPSSPCACRRNAAHRRLSGKRTGCPSVVWCRLADRLLLRPSISSGRRQRRTQRGMCRAAAMPRRGDPSSSSAKGYASRWPANTDNDGPDGLV